MQNMSAFFSIRADGTATDIDYYGNHKLWELYRTDRDAYENVWRVWRSLRRKNFHALPEDKGIPVAGTGVRRYRKSVNGAGVSANSRILPHRYADEGEKGKGHRKQIRHAEEMMWRADWVAEGYDIEDGMTVSQWFYDNSDDVDSDIIPDVYTVGETVVEWPNYGYAYSSYDYYADYDSYTYYPNAYDREMMGEYPEYECELCCGPCVMD